MTLPQFVRGMCVFGGGICGVSMMVFPTIMFAFSVPLIVLAWIASNYDG